MATGDTERTEKATARRRHEARKKGQVAVSQDLNRAFQMMVLLLVFHMVGCHLYLQFRGVLTTHLHDRLNIDINEAMALQMLKEGILKVGELLFPFFIAIFVFMIAINVAQVGFKISTEVLKINVAKLNPVKGIRKIFSLRSVVKLMWSVLKVTVLAWVVYLSLRDKLTEIAGLGGCDLTTILGYCFSLLFLILFRVGLALIALAIFDYIYQKWQYEKDLKMTKQEVKEERKDLLGDPLIKRRIRQAQYQQFKQRLAESVPAATVVVTNPTTYAVAIKYERGEMDAPQVVAKGMNMIANRIKALAREHAVPIVENKILAQTLYRTVEVGGEVPPRLYRAVAEILSYVYRLKGKL
ncbi:MAG: flagellar biosynthesis protein FlhB [Planctomycetota bacterium]|jgi:flagellar biosynthetic protein FlhB